MSLIVVGAVWGLSLATRMLRGEEDAGRWELYLAGQTSRREAVVQAIAGLASGLVALWAVTAIAAVAVGHDSRVRIAPGPALSLVMGALVFMAVGALTSQLAATRRQVAGYAAAVLGVSYALRMVADSGNGLHWMRWLTPIGWTEELRHLCTLAQIDQDLGDDASRDQRLDARQPQTSACHDSATPSTKRPLASPPIGTISREPTLPPRPTRRGDPHRACPAIPSA